MAVVPAALRQDRARAAGPAGLSAERAEPVERADDARLADYRGLTDVRLRTSWEPPHGVFIAESELVIRRALAAGYRARSLVMAPEWLERMAPLIAAVDAPVYSASYQVLRELTGFNVHRGALGSFHRSPLATVDELARRHRRLVVCEDLVSHTNLGALFRSAAALGMQAAVLSPRCADPLYRRAVRVSMGAVFTLPYARAESWPDPLRELAARGFRLVALTPAADAVALDEVQIAAQDRVAVLLGSEGPGLSAAAMTLADLRVRIPMAAGVDSLNIAAAAAVAFWALGQGGRQARTDL